MKTWCAKLGGTIVAGPFFTYNQALEAGHEYCRNNGLQFWQVTVDRV